MGEILQLQTINIDNIT